MEFLARSKNRGIEVSQREKAITDNRKTKEFGPQKGDSNILDKSKKSEFKGKQMKGRPSVHS